MPPRPSAPSRPVAVSLLVIALVVGGVAAAFAYTAGWLSPERLTPDRIVDAFSPPGKEPLGHRRNHAKGICFTGVFEANGEGAALSKARVFAKGQYPVLGRFNFGTTDPAASDVTARVKGLAISITTPDGQEWRSGMIQLPVFPVSTVQGFYDLLVASGSKDPGAMPAFVAKHPEIAPVGEWMKTAPWTASYADVRYNGLNAFLFTDSSGADHAVRWSMLPAQQPTDVPADDLAKRDPNFLEQDLQERVAAGPLHWTMSVMVANPGDPTADPSKAWPDDRKTIDVGTLTVQNVQAEANGPCRDINYDPTVLPGGIRTSDDPFPAARSSAYAVSYDRRTAEAGDYPRTTTGATP